MGWKRDDWEQDHRSFWVLCIWGCQDCVILPTSEGVIVYQHSLMFQSHGCGQRDTSPKRKAAWMKVFFFKIFETLYRLNAILCLEKTAFMFSFDPNLPSSKRVSSPSRRIYPSLSAFLITRISNQNINALRLEITLIHHCFPDQFKQIAFPHSDVMHKHANSNATLLFFFVICKNFREKCS